MQCPFCGNDEDKVLETRTNSEENYIKRRRGCLSCKKKWVTHETIEYKPLMVIKQSGRKELFDKDKIIKGISIACRKRPVALEDIVEAVDRIYYKIRIDDKNTITSEQVGNMVCDELKNMDMVAYIRFASVYRKFESLAEFRQILDISSIENKE